MKIPLFAGIPKDHLRTFALNLSVMVYAGISLEKALAILAKQRGFSPSFRQIIDEIRIGIEGGQSLSDNLQRYPRVFDRIFIAVVKLAELTGGLEQNLKYLAGQIDRELALKGRITGALIYPSIVIFLAIISVSLLLFVLFPKILPIFQSLNVELPFITRVLIFLAAWFQKLWLAFIIFIIAGVVLILFFRRIPQFRYALDSFLLKLPGIGTIIQYTNLVLISRSLGFLTKSGITFVQSFQLCAESMPNSVYQRLLSQIQQRMEGGESLSRIFGEYQEKSELIPALFSQLAIVGEEAGTLSNSFSYLAEVYEEEMSRRLQRFTTLLEPILLMTIGGMTLFIALATVLPIYKLLEGIKIGR